MIKLGLIRLLMMTVILVLAEPMNGLKVEAAVQTIQNDILMDEVTLKVE